MNQSKISDQLQLCQHCDLPLPVLSGLTINIWFVIMGGSFALVFIICLLLLLFLPLATVPFIGLISMIFLTKYLATNISRWHSDKPLGSFNWLLAHKLSVWFDIDLSMYLKSQRIVMPARDTTTEFLDLHHD